MEELFYKAELNYEKNNKKENKKSQSKMVILLDLLCIFIISLILLNFFFQRYNIKIKNNMMLIQTSIIGEINCIYEIKSITSNTKLIGNEFEKKSLFDFYIDGKKVTYTKEYKFTSFGKHKVQMKLYETINMDFMFKNIKDLISVEMNSENNCQISSMISSFEGCAKLTSFNISGFNAEQVKSMNKMFYKSTLSEFYVSSFNLKNLEDIS